MPSLLRDTFWSGNTESVLLLLCVLFVFVGLAAILTVFISRLVKSSRNRQRVAIKDDFRRTINTMVINDSFPPPETSLSPALEFQLSQLRKTLKHRMHRQCFIDQLIDTRKNVTGSSALALVHLYRVLDLDQDSLKKLTALRWQIKAKGIRELAEMSQARHKHYIANFLHSRQTILREEAFVGLVRLETTAPLSFLNAYRQTITPWMLINSYPHLQQLETRMLPQFGQWFDHPVHSVRIFAIQMARQFRQRESLPDCARLLNDPDERIVREALMSISALEGFEVRDAVAGLAGTVWQKSTLGVPFLKCLARIGDPATDLHLVRTFFDHPDYTIRFEAVRAALELNADAMTGLHATGTVSDVSSILAHLNEPLLS